MNTCCAFGLATLLAAGSQTGLGKPQVVRPSEPSIAVGVSQQVRPVQEQPRTTAVIDDRFVADSIKRLAAAGVDTRPLQEGRVTMFKRPPSDREDAFVELSDAITKTARNSEVKSTVKFETPTAEGARIRFQTVGQRKRNEPGGYSTQLSNCTEQLVIGEYFIWAERDGKPTSSPNAQFSIVEKQKTVQLEEKSGSA